ALAGPTAATAGNLNNEIGLPLTVLGLGPSHQFAVLEMGAGKPGDIEYLARIARPDVSVVNNVGPAHLERLGSLQGVAETKSEIYRNLAPDGIAVINADDRFAPFFKQRAGARRVVTFGLAGGADVRASAIQGGERQHFRLHTPAGDADAIAAALHPGARVLVKGSRSSGMERVVARVLERKGMTQPEGDQHAA